MNVLVCHSFDEGVAEKKYPREAKTILAGSTVHYLAGKKMRAQPGAPTVRIPNNFISMHMNLMQESIDGYLALCCAVVGCGLIHTVRGGGDTDSEEHEA